MAKAESKRERNTAMNAAELCRAVLRGESRAAGRVLTLIENRDPLAREILKRLYSRTGRARIIGITGNAGSGKSTLIGRMAEELRRRRKRVGILTVDPSSHFTGGALLGDRLRMRDHFLDEGVFIRSLATRGSMGGISHGVVEGAQLLDAMGKEYILIETIGIGQDQVDIAGAAQAVMAIITPHSADEIQGLKAGLYEIADLMVLNKADLAGAQEQFDRLSIAAVFSGVPIFKTSALRNEGIADLIDGLERHLAGLERERILERKALERSRIQLLALIRDAWAAKVSKKVDAEGIERWAKRVAERRCDPYSAAELIVEQMALEIAG
jgi:LAO/AO transport system kinase